MSSSWKIARLGDYIDSCLGKMLDQKKNKGELRPYLGNSNVRWGAFDVSSLAEMKFEASEYDRYGIKKGDLIICEGGEPGRCAIWDEQIPDMKIQKALHRVRTKPGLNSEYLYYWFLLAGQKGTLEPYFTGTTIKHLTGKALAELPIRLPDIDFQKRSAMVLRSFDNKIQVNRRINQTLEKIAQTLFKSWFVDFDPVRAKVAVREHFEQRAAEHGEPLPAPAALEQAQNIAAAATIAGLTVDPADIDGTRALLEAKLAGMAAEQRVRLVGVANSFPSELEKTALGESPMGWQVKPLDTIAKYQNGLALQKFRPENEDDFLPVLKIAQLKKGYTDRIEKASPNIKESCKVYDGDVIFSWSGSLVVDIWCGGDAALNQHLFKVTSKEFPKWFYYQFTKHHLCEFQRIAAAKAVTMGHIKREHLKKALCSVPPRDFIELVNSAFEPQIEKIISLRLESRLLANIRGILLPKFLSEEIQLSPVPIAEAS